jgi:hypothetical protein
MAATTIASLVTQVRGQLVEPTPNFWSDDELVAIMNLGAQDLWANILDLHQDHYIKIDESHAVLRAGETEISGVPEDCFRIQLIEPRDTSVDTAGHATLFLPKKYNHPDFIMARTRTAQDQDGQRTVFFQVSGVGPPIEAPHILTAPKLTADLLLRICYNPALPLFTSGDGNPVPGMSDNALKAWTIAYARAKESEDRIPDAGWLTVYGAEKQSILVRLTPRQEQEPDVVEDVFQGFGSIW